MKTPQYHSRAILAGVLFALTSANSVHAQKPMPVSPAVDPATHAAHVAADTPPDASADPATKTDPALTEQIAQLQAKLAQLEAVLAKNMPPMAGPPAAAPMPGMSATAAPAMAGMSDPAPPAMNMMGMMDKMMGMMDKMMSMGGGAPMPQGGSMPAGGGMGMDMMMKMDPMPPAAPAAGMNMGMDMMGMMEMGGSMATMPQSALPGFPGTSHLYHTGATGFFLDHPEHISLTTDQQASLNKIKEQALLTKSNSDRAIEQAEQALWTLTAADQPNAGKIEAKILVIEKLRGDQRLAFIRSVGEASKLLTDEQRKILTGFAPPAPAGSMATPPTPMPSAPMPAMTDM